MSAYVSFWKAKPPRRPIITPAANKAAYELAHKHLPKFKKAFRVAVEDIATPRMVADMARAVQNKSVIALDKALPVYDPRDPEAAARWGQAVQDFEDRYRELLKASGKAALGALNLSDSFSLDNPYSLPWIDKKAGALIKNISEDTRTNLRGLMRQSFVSDSMPPQVLKQMIKGHIGLRPAQAASVEKRYQNALAEGVPQVKARDIAERYAAKALDDRAEAIARTETIAAEAQGQLDAWRSASEDGLIVPGTRREWVSTPEEARTCRWCAMLDGHMVGFNEPFYTHYGSIMAPPMHVNCRCTVVLVPPDGSDEVVAPPSKPRSKPSPAASSLPPLGAAEPPPLPEPPPTKPPPPSLPPEQPEPPVRQLEPITEAQRTAIQKYQGDDYQDINGALREPDNPDFHPEWRKVAAEIEQAIDQHELEQAATLYRGFKVPIEDAANFKVGAEFVDRAFMSTTTVPKIAEDFAYKAAWGDKRPIFLELRVPAGTKALRVLDIIRGSVLDSLAVEEKEFLLQRNMQFKIISVDDSQRMMRVVVEAVMKVLKARKATKGPREVVKLSLSPRKGNGVMSSARGRQQDFVPVWVNSEGHPIKPEAAPPAKQPKPKKPSKPKPKKDRTP